MRILIVSQFFDPEPTFKGLVFARELVKLGHDVQILTGFPNYPGGVLYPEYRVRLFQIESIDDISIIRVALYPSHDNSSIKRILNYISFAFCATTLGLLLIKKPDLVYVYYTHITVELPAIMQKILRGLPIIYDIQDLWPDTLAVSGMMNNRRIMNCVDLWCQFAYRMADHIVVPSPGFKRILHERGVPEHKISIIYNWCNEIQIVSAELCETEKLKVKMKEHFTIVYAGNMGKAQALDAVLDAAHLLANKLPQVQFIFIGWGVDVTRLQQIKEEKCIPNVLFLPPRPVSEIGSILRMADTLLVHLKDDPLFEITIPSKIQAYLAVGRPIIMAVRGDAAKLVEKAGAGITCIPEDAGSIASAIEKMVHLPQEERKIMGNNGLKYYRQELALNVGVNKFENLFNSLVSK